MPPPVPIATRRDEIAYYKRNLLQNLHTIPKINVSLEMKTSLFIHEKVIE